MKIFFPFCNYQLGKTLFHYVCLFSLYSIQSYLFWSAKFAEKLIDATASRLARHFLGNKEKMAWSFVLSGYRIWKLKVNKLMSDVLLKDTQHAWVDLWMIAAEIRQTDNYYDGVILKGKSNIRVLHIKISNTLKRCVTPYEKGPKSAWIESLIRGPIFDRQCANCTLHCFFLV